MQPAALARRWPALLAGLLLGAAIGWWVFFGMPAASADRQALSTPAAENSAAPVLTSQLAVGNPAPGFSLGAAADGETVRLEDQRGKVVLLNFWATWCGPCRIEMPLLQQAYESYGADGLVVLGVDFDETAEQVQAFGRQLALSFPLLLDPGGAVQQLYRVPGYPTSAVIDREGELVAYHIGVLTQDQLDRYLELAGLFQ